MNAKSFEEASLIYDPPQGWLYGFPRPYRPLEGERLEDTLIRDGYPADNAEEAAKYCRFFARITDIEKALDNLENR